MKLIYQPIDSKICGHCCVAMVSGSELNESIKVIGHKKGTYGKELVKALIKLNCKSADKLKFPLPEKLPDKCIIRIKYESINSGHWIVFYKGLIYDPSFKYDTIEINHYKEEFLKPCKGRFISYLECE